MANYYTVVTPECGLPCTKAEATHIAKLLAHAQETREHHGFTFKWEATVACRDERHHEVEGATAEHVPEQLGYLEAEESGVWTELPTSVLRAMGKLIHRAKMPHLEFGAAFTCGRMIPGSHGGTYFRITATGKLQECELVWKE